MPGPRSLLGGEYARSQVRSGRYSRYVSGTPPGSYTPWVIHSPSAEAGGALPTGTLSFLSYFFMS